MRTRSVLLLSALAVMAGCQAPVQKEVAPTVSAPVAPAVIEAPVAASAVVAQSEKPVPAMTSVKKNATGSKKAVAAKSTVKSEPKQEAKPKQESAPDSKPKPAPEPVLSEAQALQLAKKSGCLNCHAIDRKVFGPAWSAVAVKYRGDAGAEERLATKIAKGGSGAWGATAMPANPNVGEGDRRALARFILSLK